MIRLESIPKCNNKLHKVSGHPRGVDVWFSYETPIAFQQGSVVILCENRWGTTTAKHINMVKNQFVEHTQLPIDEFEKELDAALRSVTYTK